MPDDGVSPERKNFPALVFLFCISFLPAPFYGLDTVAFSLDFFLHLDKAGKTQNKKRHFSDGAFCFAFIRFLLYCVCFV
jgi:hypothetical protein